MAALDQISFGDARERCMRFADGASVLVVIVSYRTVRLVINALVSLVSEVTDDPKLRVVVVDNTCGEDGPEIQAAIIARGFAPWAMVLISDRNGGYGYGNNLAIREAMRAPSPPSYYWMLNPDAEARTGSADALRDFLERNPQAGIVGSALLNPDESLWGFAFRFPTVISEFERGAKLGLLTRLLNRYIVPMKMGDYPEQVDWICGASMMVRRETFMSVGLFDEGFFLYHEETDLCQRVRKAGWTCWYVPASRAMHIAGGSTGVTTREGRPKRRPVYVFESRRRYFIKNHGWTYAVLVDLAWLAGFVSWRLRRPLQGRPDLDPPHLLWDSFRHSTLMKERPWNRI